MRLSAYASTVVCVILSDGGKGWRRYCQPNTSASRFQCPARRSYPTPLCTPWARRGFRPSPHSLTPMACRWAGKAGEAGKGPRRRRQCADIRRLSYLRSRTAGELCWAVLHARVSSSIPVHALPYGAVVCGKPCLGMDRHRPRLRHSSRSAAWPIEHRRQPANTSGVQGGGGGAGWERRASRLLRHTAACVHASS